MTSDNVTYYGVYKNGILVKEHRQNLLCKFTVKEKLKTYSNPEELILILRHPDENEVDQFSQPIFLKKYLDGAKISWESNPTTDDALKALNKICLKFTENIGKDESYLECFNTIKNYINKEK